MTSIPLKKYLPDVIYQIDEYKEIVRIYDLYLNKLWADVMQPLYDNQFLDTLNENGCEIHEKNLGITANLTDSLSDRRSRIKGYYASDRPYTLNKLREVLTSMCGEDGYKLSMDLSELTLSVGVGLGSSGMLSNVAEVVRKMVPANVVINVYLQYNTHRAFKKYTHGQLKTYTHGQLKADERFKEAITT